MKKIFLIGWKDVTLAFRDRAALLLMLVAPFALTLGLGFVTGRLSGGSSSGLGDIPVVLVNQDGGQLGDALVDVFDSEDLAALVALSEAADPAAARQQVDADAGRGGGHHPGRLHPEHHPGRGQRPRPAKSCPSSCTPTPPGRPASGVIKTIVDEFLSQVEVGRVGGQVAVTQLIERGLIRPQDAAAASAPQMGARQADAAESSTAITLNGNASGGEAVDFDPLAYMAPGMALMFLMFTVTYGGRTLLTERAQGTLPRLLVSPTTSAQVLGGKIFGIYLTGVAQMLILIAASALLFRLRWGDPLGVLVLVLAAVAGAVGWGMLITALAKTPGQVAAIGSAVMLIFGILGGSFINLGTCRSGSGP